MTTPFLRRLVASLSIALATAGWAHGQALTLDFQFNRNADLEQGTDPGGDDLGTKTKTRTGIAVGDGTTIDFTVVASPGNLNSADVGIGVQGGSTGGRLDPTESATFTFTRQVVVTGYTLEMFNGTDNSTFQTASTGSAQTRTTAAVTGLSLILQPGETLAISSTAGDGIRIATLSLIVPFTLDFQLNKNADLEQGSAPGATDLGTTTRTRTGILTPDGSPIDFTVVSTPTNLNSADNGIGVQGGANTRLGTGESATFTFNRPVTITGYSLNEFTAGDNSTYQTPGSGGPQTLTATSVTGLSLVLQTGEALTISSTAGDGIRIASLALTVPPLAPSSNDAYQVLHDSSSNKLDVLRNDAVGTSLATCSQPAHGTTSISGTDILYTPQANYIGTDTFTYTTTPASGSPWTVTVDVRRYPNFVFILADDQGWTGTSVQMDSNIADSKSDYYRTPNLQTLASQSIRFARGYSPHPNCSPSRYSILTSTTPARNKMTDIVGRNGTETSGQYKLITPGKLTNAIQSSLTTTPELLKSIAGSNYSAAHFGKWHLGGGGPGSHGFDSDANDGATDNADGNTGTTPINSDAKRAYSITNRAIDYLNSRVGSGTPFYLQVSHYAVHENTQATQESYDALAGVPVGTRHFDRYYAAMTADLDTNVGRLLDRLDALGIRNSTYVMYHADNGAPQDMSDNSPLRGYKPELWEGGYRVPTFVRGPGVPAGVQCNQAVSGLDWMPTILQWATGSTATMPAQTDGGSIVPLIQGLAQATPVETPVVRRGELVIHSPHYVGPLPWPNDWQETPKDMRPRSAILSGSYKLVANYEKGAIELYNLANEIGEITDLSPSELAVKWQLWIRLRDYLKSISAQMPTLDPSYPGTSHGSFVLPAATGPLGDADNDGLSDAWEFRELLTYTYDGNGDADQDGVSNAAELAQGTDPLLPNAISISSFTPLPGNQMQLTWNTTPGGSYVVERSTDLIHWDPLQNVTAGNAYTCNATVSKTQDHEFFRVKRP